MQGAKYHSACMSRILRATDKAALTGIVKPTGTNAADRSSSGGSAVCGVSDGSDASAISEVLSGTYASVSWTAAMEEVVMLGQKRRKSGGWAFHVVSRYPNRSRCAHCGTVCPRS